MCSVRTKEIAGSKVGKVISEERLAEIFLELQGKGANNINLVTPTHFVPQIIRALQSAKEQGCICRLFIIQAVTREWKL